LKKFWQWQPWNIRSKNNTSGATLIELLVVCALFLVIVSLSITINRVFNGFAVNIELEHLYIACRYMQRYAMCTHQEQHLVINIPNRTYTYGNHIHTLASSVQFGFIPTIKGPPANPTDVITRANTFANNIITFYPSGIISAGTIYVTDSSKTCCYALSNAVGTVSYVRRYVYRNKQWQHSV